MVHIGDRLESITIDAEDGYFDLHDIGKIIDLDSL
jgi:hypothetical protein